MTAKHSHHLAGGVSGVVGRQWLIICPTAPLPRVAPGLHLGVCIYWETRHLIRLAAPPRLAGALHAGPAGPSCCRLNLQSSRSSLACRPTARALVWRKRLVHSPVATPGNII